MTSTVLELAISLTLLYLIISGFCSALQELVSNTLRWRSKILEEALGKLLRDPDVAKKVYGHALAAGLWSPAWLRKDNPRKPSYIPTEMFARIVLDLHDNHELKADSSEIMQKLVQGVETDIEKKRAAVGKWFDDSMGRVSGWYKRKAHAWLWVIAVVVCAVLNADTIGLARLLWNDEALRQSMVTAATTSVKAAASANDEKKAGADAGSSGSPQDATTKVFESVKAARTKLDESGIPLGWCGATSCWPLGGTPLEGNKDPRLISEDWAGWLLRIAGIVITSLAVSQGALFWFDLLQKLVNLRLSGDKPS